MSSRVAILETIAQQNAAGMAALRDEMRRDAHGHP